MSHRINTTIGFPRSNREIKTALKKYFEPGCYDLNYKAILPPPRGLHGEQLGIWMGANWGSRPFTFEGKIRGNKLEFYTLNGIPAEVYKALAKRVQDYLLITTASWDDMAWAQVEFRANGDSRVIYRASEDEDHIGNVPPSILRDLELHRSMSEQKTDNPEPMAPQAQPTNPSEVHVDEAVPF